MRRLLACALLLALSLPVVAASLKYRASAAKVAIAPQLSVWLGGSRLRTHASDPTSADLYARALALDDGAGHTVLIFSIDLLGLPRTFTERVAAEIMKTHGLDRSQILFTFTHTHNAPLVPDLTPTLEPTDKREQRRMKAYSDTLAHYLPDLANTVLANLQPAFFTYDTTQASFSINRRLPDASGATRADNREGRVDPLVPILRVTTLQGQVLALLFGYACDNATLDETSTAISGDYAGIASASLEKIFSGSIALYLPLCGADVAPKLRGDADLATAQGVALAQDIARVVKTPMTPLGGKLHTAYLETTLPFAPFTKETFDTDTASKDPARMARARIQTALLAERKEQRQLPYPVQVIRFDRGFSLVALAGAPVVEYAYLVRKLLSKDQPVVAGFANELSCYVPTAAMIGEGGYEVVDSMVEFGHPASFTPDVEQRVLDTVKRAWQRATAKQ